MNTHARTSLNRKLLRLVLGVQLLVAIATLGSAVAVNLRQERRRLKEIEAQVQESIATKANVMVSSHALAMRGMVLDHAFMDMQKNCALQGACSQETIASAYWWVGRPCGAPIARSLA